MSTPKPIVNVFQAVSILTALQALTVFAAVLLFGGCADTQPPMEGPTMMALTAAEPVSGWCPEAVVWYVPEIEGTVGGCRTEGELLRCPVLPAMQAHVTVAVVALDAPEPGFAQLTLEGVAGDDCGVYEVDVEPAGDTTVRSIWIFPTDAQ